MMNTLDSSKKRALLWIIGTVFLAPVVAFCILVLLLMVLDFVAATFGSHRSSRIACDRMAIAQLEMALKAFKERFGDYPPDFGEETDDQKVAAVKTFLSKVFPKCPESNYPAEFQSPEKFDSKEYNPATALVFWLGGLRDAKGNAMGFSADLENPFDINNRSRIWPFFEFDQQHLDKSGGGMKYYPPSYRGDHSQGCYVYFRAENGTYAGKTYAEAGNSGAMQDTQRSTDRKIEYMNPKSFQIRSFGLDGRWSATPQAKWGVMFPTGSDYHEEDFDDLANFCPGTFEDSIPE